jgi:hypothetical protein
MRMSAKVMNVRDVIQSLERATEDMERDFSKTLKRMGLLIQREAMKVTPVDLGVLKLSAFTKSQGKGFDTVVSVGYGASYAIYVHETHPTKKKFLEKTYRSLIPIIRKELMDALEG